MAAKKNTKNQKGQALIEFILFLPFLIMLYFSILSMGNAINGSINQQKLSRAYFYYRAANNSTLPRPTRRDSEVAENWSKFGMQIMGWAFRFENNVTPVAPCYKFIFPIESGEEESCDEAYTETVTKFIRVQTVYGICGATYDKENGQVRRQPAGSTPNSNIAVDACHLVN